MHCFPPHTGSAKCCYSKVSLNGLYPIIKLSYFYAIEMDHYRAIIVHYGMVHKDVPRLIAVFEWWLGC